MESFESNLIKCTSIKRQVNRRRNSLNPFRVPKLSAIPRGHVGIARVKVLQVAKFRGVPPPSSDFTTVLNETEGWWNARTVEKKVRYRRDDIAIPNFKIMNFHGA